MDRNPGSEAFSIYQVSELSKMGIFRFAGSRRDLGKPDFVKRVLGNGEYFAVPRTLTKEIDAYEGSIQDMEDPGAIGVPLEILEKYGTPVTRDKPLKGPTRILQFKREKAA